MPSGAQEPHGLPTNSRHSHRTLSCVLLELYIHKGLVGANSGITSTTRSAKFPTGKSIGCTEPSIRACGRKEQDPARKSRSITSIIYGVRDQKTPFPLNSDIFIRRTGSPVPRTRWSTSGSHGGPPRRCYHDREWAAKMKEIGLQPSDKGEQQLARHAP